MSGAPHRNADKINTIGIVVVGICGAVLVYVSIVALQAFYVNDTSEIQHTADYGGNDTPAKNAKADQIGHISAYGINAGTAGTYHLPIARAEELIVAAAPDKNGTWPGAPGTWVPATGPSATATSLPIFGRGHPIVSGGAGSGSAAPSPDPAGAGSNAGSAAAGSAAGSAAPAAGSAGSAAPAAGSAAAGGHAP